MIQRDKVVLLLLLSLMTILLLFDFFPGISEIVLVPKPILVGSLLVVYCAGIFLLPFQKEQKFDVLWQAVFPLYLLILIVIFTLLGGNSQSGISFSNPILWVVLLISALDIRKSYKKGMADQSVM
ncbi:hypothetical protein NCCP2222_13110 [Sporosarcina sp. NCCP-2222]|uniref:hypothetical protein n=1 Tax=Sporosarcina sp. NCCP-2222 TaxID=2935073 RepID=UPI00207EFCA1|nr:hypothetical protein [Sporosarcina sp. NCCP-2222]GKV55364.1 hypothetical protein NCCP2222_13110 [Sporosarcina sp. NCCP-2222]